MSKRLKISLFSIIFIATLVTSFAIFKTVEADASQCYYPNMFIDRVDEVYNHSVCGGNFQLYYFPVIADGRKYTITLNSIDGDQKLYASRYKPEVDDLNDLLNWACNDDHCDSAIRITDKTKVVTFTSPTGEESYYSWFAVYGIGSGTQRYQIGISNNGVLANQTLVNTNVAVNTNTNTITNTNTTNNYLALTSVPNATWRYLAPQSSIDLSDISWTSIAYNDSNWTVGGVPDWGNWKCDDCYKQYRGTFDLTTVPNNLKLKISADDGLWLYVNGAFIGHWGASGGTDKLHCVNNILCPKNDKLDPILLTNLQTGKNVISAVVYDGGYRESLKLDFLLE